MIRPEELDIDQNSPLSPQKTVYKASLGSEVVAVKILSAEASPSNLLVRAEKWKTIDHPNLLRFIDACSEDADPLFIVTEYHESGSVSDYLGHHPNADRPQLILDVAFGMQYLHSRGFVHGSLKTSDILVNASGEACVADYCMTEVQASKSNDGHRYFSPEAWKGTTSKASDIFAFAMCALEIFTSSPPWGVLPEKHIVRMVVHEDARPDRPDYGLSLRVGLTDQMWDIIEESWHKEARLRPTFDIIARLWQAACSGNLPPSKPGARAPQTRLQSPQITNRGTTASPEPDDVHALERSPPPAYSPGENPGIAQEVFQNRDAKGRARTTGPRVVNVGSGASTPGYGLPTPPLEINKIQRPSSSGSSSQGYQRGAVPNARAPARQQSFHTPPPSAPAGAQTFNSPSPPPAIQIDGSSTRSRQSMPPGALLGRRTSTQPRALSQEDEEPRLPLPSGYREQDDNEDEKHDDVGMSLYASSSPPPPSNRRMMMQRDDLQYRAGSPPQQPLFDNRRASLMPTNPGVGRRASRMAASVYSNDSEGTGRGLTKPFAGLMLTEDVQSISDIGSLNGGSRINPVLVVGALEAEIKDGRSPEAIDEHLLKIDQLASQNEKTAQKFITAGVIPVLILLLKRRAVSDDPGLDTVLMALGTLACDTVSANIIFRTDTIKTLIELFTTSESDDVVGLSLWILGRMSRSPEIAQGLIKAGLVKELINRGLRGGTGAAVLSAWCLGALVHTDAIADALADQHFVIPDIVDHLRHMTNLGAGAAPGDVSSGLFAVARMSRSIRLAKAIAKAGAVEFLAHHLNTASDPEVLNWSARAVGCLMRPNSSDMSKILLEKGTAVGLARMPRVLPQDEVEPLASFAFAISRFSCAEWGGGTRKALVDAGVVDSLLSALRTASDEPYPQVHIELALAVSFLGDVGGSAIRKEIINAGGVKILKEIARDAVNGTIGVGRGDEVAKACNMAATSISGNIWTRNAASAKTAMNHNWSGGCPEYHPPCPLKFQLPFDPMAAT
ncbi:hypothetical protein V5O48_001523 [Marasmius crinis-equi]|uniref:Protein kinase domain-containing protein n=1 Tax=Marasmius crinis-equi TaxID=585013 RepID=A0ABR3FYT1_9AGAR